MGYMSVLDQGARGVPVLALAGLTVLLGVGVCDAQQRHELQDGKWVQQQANDPDSPAGELDTIRRLIAQGEGEKAKELADQWIESHPDHALLPEAYLVRGDANVTRENFFKSLFDYEYVIREFPSSEQFHTAQQREFELAKLFVSGTKRRLWGMRILPATGEAEEIFIRIQERSPGSELGEMASLALADYYFNKPQMDSASEAYDLFLINYPDSERREWAMLRLIQANLARFKGPNFDATGLIDAAQRLKTYRMEFPASAQRIGVEALLIRIDESLAMRDMEAAKWHEVRHQPHSAAHLYQRVVQDYPQTAAAQDAIERLDEMGVEVLPVERSPDQDRPAPQRVPLPEPIQPPTADELDQAVQELGQTQEPMEPGTQEPAAEESVDEATGEPVKEQEVDEPVAPVSPTRLPEAETLPPTDPSNTQPEKP